MTARLRVIFGVLLAAAGVARFTFALGWRSALGVAAAYGLWWLGTWNVERGLVEIDERLS